MLVFGENGAAARRDADVLGLADLRVDVVGQLLVVEQVATMPCDSDMFRDAARSPALAPKPRAAEQVFDVRLASCHRRSSPERSTGIRIAAPARRIRELSGADSLRDPIHRRGSAHGCKPLACRGTGGPIS